MVENILALIAGMAVFGFILMLLRDVGKLRSEKEELQRQSAQQQREWQHIPGGIADR